MTVLDAPVLAGSRLRARQLLADLSSDLSGVTVELRCGALIAATAAFADEIIHEVLVARGAKALRVTGASDNEFIDRLRERSGIHGVSDRLQFPS